MKSKSEHRRARARASVGKLGHTYASARAHTKFLRRQRARRCRRRLTRFRFCRRHCRFLHTPRVDRRRRRHGGEGRNYRGGDGVRKRGSPSAASSPRVTLSAFARVRALVGPLQQCRRQQKSSIRSRRVRRPFAQETEVKGANRRASARARSTRLCGLSTVASDARYRHCRRRRRRCRRRRRRRRAYARRA